MHKVALCALLVAGIAGCKPAAVPGINDPLAGAIPECPALLAVENDGYIKAAQASCNAASTLDERMKNKGCEIIERKGKCVAVGMFPSP